MKALPPERAARRVPFNVVMVYEDFDTGAKAKQVFDYIVGHMGSDCEFFSSLWPLGMLDRDQCATRAASQAARADMVILSLHGDGRPADELQTWIESWIHAETERSRALVALFDRDGEREQKSRHSPRAYFERVARRAHMDFFVEPAALQRSDEADGEPASVKAELLWLI